MTPNCWRICATTVTNSLNTALAFWFTTKCKCLTPFQQLKKRTKLHIVSWGSWGEYPMNELWNEMAKEVKLVVVHNVSGPSTNLKLIGQGFRARINYLKISPFK